jgi:hypothetical protein
MWIWKAAAVLAVALIVIFGIELLTDAGTQPKLHHVIDASFSPGFSWSAWSIGAPSSYR